MGCTGADHSILRVHEPLAPSWRADALILCLKNPCWFLSSRAVMSGGLLAKCPFQISSWTCWKFNSVRVGLTSASEGCLPGEAFPRKWLYLHVLPTCTGWWNPVVLGRLSRPNSNSCGRWGDGQWVRGPRSHSWALRSGSEKAGSMRGWGPRGESIWDLRNRGHCSHWGSSFSGPLGSRGRERSLWPQHLWEEGDVSHHSLPTFSLSWCGLQFGQSCVCVCVSVQRPLHAQSSTSYV